MARLNFNDPMRNKGFTLIEVLIALAILAIALTAIVKATNENVNNAILIKDKTLAHFVGMNILASVQANILPLPKDNHGYTGNSPMGNRTWYWQVGVVEGSDNPYITPIFVSVKKNAKDEIIDRITGYVKARVNLQGINLGTQQ